MTPNPTPPPRRLWLFRPPKNAALEKLAKNDSLLVPDFGVQEDLSDHIEDHMILEEMIAAHPGEGRRKVESLTSQMHLLLNDIQPGDLIISPMRLSSDISIGIAAPGKGRCPEGRPGREVEWLCHGVARTQLLPDMIHSLGAKQTICAITRNDAASRVEEVLRSGRDPGPAFIDRTIGGQIPENTDDLEVLLRKRLISSIGSAFAGHDLATLSAAVLEAGGYSCQISPPGPDGGVDIIAGQGLIGMSDSLVVQVKSGDIKADHPTLQQLVGAMSQAGAGQGLLICWGGVTRSVQRKIQDEWFRVRVWGAEDLVQAVLDNYEALPLGIRDRLGFRQVWI